jgi:monolysocardiolipin acyltransferase
MPIEEKLSPPGSLPWRIASTATLGTVGVLSKTFLTFATKKEVCGLEGFVKLLDGRRDVDKREKGLLTGMPSGRAGTPGLSWYTDKLQ